MLFNLEKSMSTHNQKSHNKNQFFSKIQKCFKAGITVVNQLTFVKYRSKRSKSKGFMYVQVGKGENILKGTLMKS